MRDVTYDRPLQLPNGGGLFARGSADVGLSVALAA